MYPDRRKFVEFHDALVRDGFVCRDFSHVYRVVKPVSLLFQSHDFVAMWLNNAIFLQDGLIGITVFFHPVLYRDNYPEPPIVLSDVPTGTERISHSMDSLFLKNLRIGIADIFRTTGNLVKKEFPKSADMIPGHLL
jgi:hypothetical protein